MRQTHLFEKLWRRLVESSKNMLVIRRNELLLHIPCLDLLALYGIEKSQRKFNTTAEIEGITGTPSMMHGISMVSDRIFLRVACRAVASFDPGA